MIDACPFCHRPLVQPKWKHKDFTTLYCDEGENKNEYRSHFTWLPCAAAQFKFERNGIRFLYSVKKQEFSFIDTKINISFQSFEELIAYFESVSNCFLFIL